MNGQRAALTPVLPSTSEHRQSGAKARSMETEQRLKRLTGRENKCRLVNVSPRGRTGSAQHVCIRTAQIRLDTLPLLPHAAGARKVEWAESVPVKDDKGRK